MRRRAVLILCMLVVFLETHSQVMTIDSIIKNIEKNNPVLQKYGYRINALDTYATAAKSWDAPQVGAGFFMLPYKLSPNMGSVMLSVQQMIPNPGKLNSSYNYLNQKSSLERESRNFDQNQLIAMAKMLYYDWIILKKKEQVLRSNQSQMNFLIQTSEARLAYEQEKLNSIYKAKAALLEIDKEQLMYDREIAEKRVGLNTLMNRDKNSSFDIDTNYRIKDYSMILTDTIAVARSRSDIRMIDQSVKLMVLNEKIELSRRNPDFGIKYDHMFGLGNQPDQFTLMGMITIPIAPWSSRSYRSNIKAMDLETQSMQKEKEARVNEVSGKLISLRNQIENLKKQLNLYETGIISALKKNYQTTMLAYEQNTTDLFLVIDAWQTLTMTEIQSLDSLRELLEMQVEFEKEIEQK